MAPAVPKSRAVAYLHWPNHLPSLAQALHQNNILIDHTALVHPALLLQTPMPPQLARNLRPVGHSCQPATDPCVCGRGGGLAPQCHFGKAHHCHRRLQARWEVSSRLKTGTGHGCAKRKQVLKPSKMVTNQKPPVWENTADRSVPSTYVSKSVGTAFGAVSVTFH